MKVLSILLLVACALAQINGSAGTCDFWCKTEMGSYYCCPTETPIPPPQQPQPTEECKDTEPSSACEAWKRQNLCSSYENVCSKTCGACKGLFITSTPGSVPSSSISIITNTPGLFTTSTPGSVPSSSISIITNTPGLTTGKSRLECEGVKCTWNLWNHYDAKGCTPEYTNGSCCPSHFTCPQPENLNPEKCYLFGKEYNLNDDIPLNGEGDKCWSGCRCHSIPGERADIICAQDVGLCWNWTPASPGCRHRHNSCGGCPDEVCGDSIPHICSWNEKTYKEGEYMSFDGEYACHTCICQKNFTGPTGEGCKKIRCGHSGIDVRSNCVDVYHKNSCCPFGSICDNDPKIQSIPNTSRVSTGLTCTMGKFALSVGDQLKNEDCRYNCTCVTPPEITCIKNKNCLQEVPDATQCILTGNECHNGECRQYCGDLVEVADQCSGNGCKCCRHEKCAKDIGMCRMHCLDDEFEDTWTGFGCGFANNFKNPEPKCCVKNSLSTTEFGPL